MARTAIEAPVPAQQVTETTHAHFKKNNEGSIEAGPIVSLPEYIEAGGRSERISERILGFATLHQVNKILRQSHSAPIAIPEISIIDPQVAQEILEQSRLSDSTQRQIAAAFQNLSTELFPKVTLRHAITIPGIPDARLNPHNDLGSPNDVIKAICKMVRTFEESGYSQIKGAECRLFMQQYADPREIPRIITRESLLPAGGEAHLATHYVDGSYIVRLFGVMGDNAAVHQGNYDEYLVLIKPGEDNIIRNLTIIERKISHKPHMLLERQGTGEFTEHPLPPEVQRKPSISDEDIVRIAKATYLASAIRNTPMRIEFSQGTPQLGMVATELKPYTPPPEVKPQVIKSRIFAVIEHYEQVKWLHEQLAKSQIPQDKPLFLAIAPSLARKGERLDKVLRQLRSFPVQTTFLIPGVAETEHRALQAVANSHHRVLATHIQDFRIENTVRVEMTNHTPARVINEDLAGGIEGLVSLREVAAAKIPTHGLGDKAFRLKELAEAGHNIPFSFVLDRTFFIKLLEANELTQVWNELLNVRSQEQLQRLFKQIREGIVSLPECWHKTIRDTILANLPLSQTLTISVRSSVRGEDSFLLPDGRRFSLPGRLQTFLNVAPDDLGRKALQCFCSAFSEQIALQILPDNSPENLRDTKAVVSYYFASILIQEMIKSRSSGVVLDGEIVGKTETQGSEIVAKKLDPNIVVIEVQTGIAGAVGRDDHNGRPRLTIRFNKQTGAMDIALGYDHTGISLTLDDLKNPPAEIAPYLPSITSGEIWALIDETRLIKEELGFPADIEWAIGTRSSKGKDGHEELFILQARPR